MSHIRCGSTNMLMHPHLLQPPNPYTHPTRQSNPVVSKSRGTWWCRRILFSGHYGLRVFTPEATERGCGCLAALHGHLCEEPWSLPHDGVVSAAQTSGVIRVNEKCIGHPVTLARVSSQFLNTPEPPLPRREAAFNAIYTGAEFGARDCVRFRQEGRSILGRSAVILHCKDSPLVILSRLVLCVNSGVII